MLLWNLKNVEYALGANLSDLSMQFWDIDERHAFEGDHVMLRQGFSSVVQHMYGNLKKRSDFDCKFCFPVGRIAYAQKTSTSMAEGAGARAMQLIELSDTCTVTNKGGDQKIECDFVVCCVPLGVLKQSLSEPSNPGSIMFDPPLPFTKSDSIQSVGFGLLNKVYLQFSNAFWRDEGGIDADQTLFGNASNTNPHHYMFLDVGRTLGSPENAPAILMSLVSGREAVRCEALPEEEVMKEALATLRTIFGKSKVPIPTKWKATKWGSDIFSRGSYTFLPPGTTDQDFHLLQSPVNGNGDSLVLEGSEVMRLFFAGEHTTALHPSMAHGALMTGLRAAKEVFSAMQVSLDVDNDTDRLIPMALHRHMNPKSNLCCAFCGKPDTTVREGSLLAFKKGARHAVVHNCCAENSPEVEVFEGEWKNVFHAISRAKTITCNLCNKKGASIGCSYAGCSRCFHFRCAEDMGWRFEVDGKEFFCDKHHVSDRCVRISQEFYRTLESNVTCSLCGVSDANKTLGALLPFQKRTERVLVHDRCARFSTIVDMDEDTSSRWEQDYRNVFTAIERAKHCFGCGKLGATVGCSQYKCNKAFHVACAEKDGWNLDRRPKYLCSSHQVQRRNAKQPDSVTSSKESPITDAPTKPRPPAGLFQHALFSGNIGANPDVPGNLDIDPAMRQNIADSEGKGGGGGGETHEDPVELLSSSESEPEDIGLDRYDGGAAEDEEVLDIDAYILSQPEPSCSVETRLARLYRKGLSDRWNVEFSVTRGNQDGNKAFLSLAVARPDPFDEIQSGDVVSAINGKTVGSSDLDTMEKVFSLLKTQVDVMVELQRKMKF